MTSRVAAANHYEDAAEGWAGGATLVYAPLARELLARSPHPLAGRRVLDVGAGTGVASEVLVEAGAQPVALDLSWSMLAWRREARPPAVVASVTEVPVRSAAVDDVVASFVLNHLPEPVAAMAELARAGRTGGAFLATVYSNDSTSPVRDRVDEVAVEHGFEVPAWYRAMKASIIPILGSASAMADAARRAGLEVVQVDELPVDVGVHRAEDLVRYRFGQAQYAEFVGSLDPAEDAEIRAAAVTAIEPIMEPYRPIVVFLTARVR